MKNKISMTLKVFPCLEIKIRSQWIGASSNRITAVVLVGCVFQQGDNGVQIEHRRNARGIPAIDYGEQGLAAPIKSNQFVDRNRRLEKRANQ